MIFKAIVDKWDTHVHFSLFVGDVEGNLALTGKLCMRDYEFIVFAEKIDIIEPKWANDKIRETK